MKKIQTLIGVAFIFCTNICYGQVDSDTTKKTIDLNEVIISVNKTEETKKAVAQQVQVIRKDEIENAQAQSTPDLIANSGSVFMQKSQQGGGSPVIRGFEANRILLVIDGVRMNNLIYRAGHLQNLVTTDNSILERAEILFGPSSTVYGSDALGGVIHLYTRQPVFSLSEKKKVLVNAFTRYSSVNNENTGHFDFNVGGMKLASLTSFTFSKFDHLKGGENQNPYYTTSFGERPYYVERFGNTDSLVKNDDRYRQVQSGFSQYDILQRLSYKANEHLTHGLNIQFSNSNDVPRYDRLTDPDGSGGLRYAEWYYGPQTRLMAAYDMNRINEAKFFQHIHAGVNYQKIEESRHTRRFGNDHIQHRIENVNVMGANLELQRKASVHNMRMGVDAQYNTLKSTANEEDITTGVSDKVDTRYPDGDNSMMNVAAYWSHTWTINDEVSIVDGVRVGFVSLHSTFVDTSFHHLPYLEADQSNLVYSGSVGLIHTPSEDVKLSLLFSTGFRAPNVDDLSKVFESSPGSVIVPNADLKPERTINTELGIALALSKKTTWENTAYYTQFVDAIVTDEYTYNGEDSIIYDGTLSAVYANQNKQRAYLYGFSSTLRSQLSDRFSMFLSANYTYGRIKTDSSDFPLDHIPPFMLRLNFSYAFKNFHSDFFVNYNGWKKMKDYYPGGEDNEQYATPEGMPAWYTINFHAAYTFPKLLIIRAGVDNIFNTQYRTFASGINGAGRNYFLTVGIRV